MATTTMKALNYLGPYQVRVEDVEKPKMEHPDDIIVKVTTVSDVKSDNFILKNQTNRVSRLPFAVRTCSEFSSNMPMLLSRGLTRTQYVRRENSR
jgi:hypothetical protein